MNYRAIAKATKDCCRADGSGNFVVVFADDTWMESPGGVNGITGKMAPGGERIRPVASLGWPMDAATVRQIVESK